MNSVEKASGYWAYLYFCIYYFVINMVLLDLTIAMTIEMYNAISNKYFNIKEDGDNDQGIYFAVRWWWCRVGCGHCGVCVVHVVKGMV